MINFVFVVCGADAHIQTLNFSLQCLRRFTKNKILVVTDLSRNKAEIQHDNIIDIQTPKEFSHHQASIYLKTSLHKIIDLSDINCYLDSDVIALSPGVDEIFNYKSGPVTFASDHTDISQFSPFAVHCNCYNRFKELESLIKKHNPYIKEANIHNPGTRSLYCYLDEMKKNKISFYSFILRHNFKKIFYHNKFRAGNDFYYDPITQTWLDKKNTVLMYDARNYKDKIENESSFRYSVIKHKWLNENGHDAGELKCDHLVESIRNKFKVSIDKNWTHWNGGVFLFGKDSADFLESWHNKTMQIFNDPGWNVRDQGTLAATAWEFGLQNSSRISMEYNFLADFYDPFIAFDRVKGFTKDNFKTSIIPRFIHIYHNFGNKEWDIWQGVEEVLNIT